MKLKIATHDSATGETGKGLLSWFLTPFAKTQHKTIREQYEAGCRSFDIRIKLCKGNVWRCAHGPWITKKLATDIFNEINSFEERCQVCIVYEGKLDVLSEVELRQYVNIIKKSFNNIIWGYVAGKYARDTDGVNVKYEYIYNAEEGYEGGEQGFLPLDGKSWHTYIPIPWLWKKIYYNKPIFNEKTFTYVDFL